MNLAVSDVRYTNTLLLHYSIVSILSQTHDNKRNNRHVYLYLYICALFNVYCFVSFRLQREFFYVRVAMKIIHN